MNLDGVYDLRDADRPELGLFEELVEQLAEGPARMLCTPAEFRAGRRFTGALAMAVTSSTVVVGRRTLLGSAKPVWVRSVRALGPGVVAPGPAGTHTVLRHQLEGSPVQWVFRRRDAAEAVARHLHRLAVGDAG